MKFGVFIRLFLNIIKTILLKQKIFTLWEFKFFIYLLVTVETVGMPYATKILKTGHGCLLTWTTVNVI